MSTCSSTIDRPPTSLSVKYSNESDVLTFDFTNKLETGETLNVIPLPVMGITVIAGVDASPAGVLLNAPQLSGFKVLQEVTSGIGGVVYQISCTVTTSNDRVLTLAGILPVVEL